MLKVSFKDDFKKVQTFNDKAIVVTLTGKILCPSFISDCLPPKVWEWVNHHQSVEVSESYLTTGLYYIIKMSGKSVCSDNDAFDAQMGERIAESRAKIKLYKFMHTLCKKLMYCYYGYIYGVPEGRGTYKTATLSDYHGGLQDACRKYAELWVKESRHLNSLIEST
jgi:hypothetical protein